jgi:hypothetical protein
VRYLLLVLINSFSVWVVHGNSVFPGCFTEVFCALLGNLLIVSKLKNIVLCNCSESNSANTVM